MLVSVVLGVIVEISQMILIYSSKTEDNSAPSIGQAISPENSSLVLLECNGDHRFRAN